MRYTRLAILTFSIGVAFSAYASGQSKTRANVPAGKELFHQHCSACHGNDGKGLGSMYDPNSADKSRRVRPADLTVMSQQNAGKFPADRVREAIYNKKPVPGHGTSDMPAWGDVFYNQKSDQKRLEARVRDLTAYIESLQVKGK
ncbi:MAG TPA: c-type cytochrome [Bryobacteraceae bacterium]|jgi:mono/diheme cytochrome c family protein|nr:c-type cytochrome [Bryobacteraceae bacterium]